MNNDRRKAIRAVIATIESAKTDLEALRDEEREAYDAMPEGLQGSERGQASDLAATALETACDTLDQAVGEMEEACQ